MFKLDFSLVTAAERSEFIAQHNLSVLKPSEIELCANYILYGKNEQGKSVVDEKLVQINTKYNSYSQAAPVSLDALMENPNFDEGILSRNQTHYKNAKPTIDRTKDADIPTMKEMWANIDELQHLLDVNLGKVEDPTVKRLSDSQIYRLRHNLIDIRRGQYYLKDIFKPTIGHTPNRLDYILMDGELDISWNDLKSDYAFAPMGLIGDNGLAYKVFYDIRNVDYAPDLYNFKAKYIIDFRNPTHVYKMLEQYEEFVTSSLDKPDSLMGLIAKTLDYYIERANLHEQHYTIIEMKKRKCTNKQITEKLAELYGLHHTDNYISTIYTQKICVEIANAAILHYDMFLLRDDDNAWKVCNTCGKVKLKDNRLFVKKAKAKDGFSSRCKVCDRIAREQNKRR